MTPDERDAALRDTWAIIERDMQDVAELRELRDEIREAARHEPTTAA